MKELKTNYIRQDVIKMLAQKGGHTASNLSVVDVFAALCKTAKPTDKILVSEHLTPALQATLAHIGHFSKKQLLQPTKKLPEGTKYPLSTAIGMAHSARIDGKQTKAYCVINDDEHQQGHVWEAAMHAGKHKLNNLMLIINRNNVQENGYVENIMSLEPLNAKYAAFNWHVIEVDGHNQQHIKEAFAEAHPAKPTVIIAHTIPGKGVSFIENKYEWHAKTPTKQEETEAITELQK